MRGVATAADSCSLALSLSLSLLSSPPAAAEGHPDSEQVTATDCRQQSQSSGQAGGRVRTARATSADTDTRSAGLEATAAARSHPIIESERIPGVAAAAGRPRAHSSAYNSLQCCFFFFFT